MVGRPTPGRSACSLCPGLGLGTLSSLSLADSSFLSWSEEPDLELASEENLCSGGVSIQRRRVWCDSREPFLGRLRGLGWVSDSGGGGSTPGKSGGVRPKVLGGTGGGKLGEMGSVLLDSSCSQEGPARSSELFHSELLVFAKYRGVPSTFSSCPLSRTLFLSRIPGVYLKARFLQRRERRGVCIGHQQQTDNHNRLLLPLDRLTQHKVPLLEIWRFSLFTWKPTRISYNIVVVANRWLKTQAS